MSALVERLLSSAAGPMERMGVRFFKIAALFFITVICLLAGRNISEHRPV